MLTKQSKEEQELQSKLDKSADREKVIVTAHKKKTIERNKPIDLNSLTPDEQRTILFNTFPGDKMGIVVGKPDPKDPYNALIPKEAKDK